VKQSLINLGVILIWATGLLFVWGSLNTSNSTSAILGVGLLLYALLWRGLENIIANQHSIYRALSYIARKKDDAE